MASAERLLEIPFNEDPDAEFPALEIQPAPGLAPDYAVVHSVSFNHNFFCVRVMREETYCDGIVFNRLTGLPIVEFPQTEQPFVENRLQELVMIVKERGPLSNDRAINVLRTLLLHIADFKLRATQLPDGEAKRDFQISPLVQSFQTLVEETYAEHRDASFYAEDLGISPATLNRAVKSELGLTVMQAVNERLAIEARVALRSGKRSVKDVAFDLGFNDPLYFSRFFRKHFGKPPSQYFLANGAETQSAT